MVHGEEFGVHGVVHLARVGEVFVAFEVVLCEVGAAEVEEGVEGMVVDAGERFRVGELCRK